MARIEILYFSHRLIIVYKKIFFALFVPFLREMMRSAIMPEMRIELIPGESKFVNYTMM